MLKKFIFWSPLFVLISITIDMYLHWGESEYRWICITAALGWLMYWDLLNDTMKKDSDDV